MPHEFSSTKEHLHGLLVQKAEDKISTELDGETVILDINSGVYRGLDQVGTAIWNMLEEPVSIHEMKEAILAQYDVGEQQCLIDLLEFLKKLAENKLIVYSNAENI